MASGMYAGFKGTCPSGSDSVVCGCAGFMQHLWHLHLGNNSLLIITSKIAMEVASAQLKKPMKIKKKNHPFATTCTIVIWCINKRYSMDSVEICFRSFAWLFCRLQHLNLLNRLIFRNMIYLFFWLSSIKGWSHTDLQYQAHQRGCCCPAHSCLQYNKNFYFDHVKKIKKFVN